MALEKQTARKFSTLCACRSGLMEWMLIVFCVAALCSVGPVFAEGDDLWNSSGTPESSAAAVPVKGTPSREAWDSPAVLPGGGKAGSATTGLKNPGDSTWAPSPPTAKGPGTTVDIFLTTNHALFAQMSITMASPELSTPAHLLLIRRAG